MSFKERYLSEADSVPVEAVKNLNPLLNPSYSKAPGSAPTAPRVNTGPTKVDNTAPLAPESLAKASGAKNPTINDLQSFKRTSETMHDIARRDNSTTPQTRTSLQEMESIIPSKNKLTERLKEAGINTGFNKTDVLKDIVTNPKKEVTKTGMDMMLWGEKQKYGLDRSHEQRQVNTINNSGLNGDMIKRGTMLAASTHLKIGMLLEEADIDPKWGTHAPGSKVKTVIMKKGVKPVDHTRDTHKMIDDMQNVIQAKQKRQNIVRRETMPEPYNPPAATQTMGLHMNDANVRDKYRGPEARAKEINAQTRAQKEERLSGGQQNG